MGAERLLGGDGVIRNIDDVVERLKPPPRRKRWGRNCATR
jgi:hypothetical protein